MDRLLSCRDGDYEKHHTSYFMRLRSSQLRALKKALVRYMYAIRYELMARWTVARTIALLHRYGNKSRAALLLRLWKWEEAQEADTARDVESSGTGSQDVAERTGGKSREEETYELGIPWPDEARIEDEANELGVDTGVASDLANDAIRKAQEESQRNYEKAQEERASANARAEEARSEYDKAMESYRDASARAAEAQRNADDVKNSREGLRVPNSVRDAVIAEGRVRSSTKGGDSLIDAAGAAAIGIVSGLVSVGEALFEALGIASDEPEKNSLGYGDDDVVTAYIDAYVNAIESGKNEDEASVDAREAATEVAEGIHSGFGITITSTSDDDYTTDNYTSDVDRANAAAREAQEAADNALESMNTARENADRARANADSQADKTVSYSDENGDWTHTNNSDGSSTTTLTTTAGNTTVTATVETDANGNTVRTYSETNTRHSDGSHTNTKSGTLSDGSSGSVSTNTDSSGHTTTTYTYTDSSGKTHTYSESSGGGSSGGGESSD